MANLFSANPFAAPAPACARPDDEPGSPMDPVCKSYFSPSDAVNVTANPSPASARTPAGERSLEPSLSAPASLLPGAAPEAGAAEAAAAPPQPSHFAVGRRTSVSAESLNPTAVGGDGGDGWRPPLHPKTSEQMARLHSAVARNFLFRQLDEDQFTSVLGALVEKVIPRRGIKVVSQGDAGDYFYVVESGVFDVYIHPSGALQPGADGLGSKVASIAPGGSFGELALMYNAPRAATVVSASDARSTLWALDRITFRRIVMDSAFRRRRMYEVFLEEVPLLASLERYERAKIADALQTVRFSAGQTVIRQGDRGDRFYLLEAGEADAFKQGIDRPLMHYRRGMYFGELALLDDQPRAATVVAATDIKLVSLERDAFNRLLGPVQDILRRTREGYAAVEKQLRE